MESLNHLKNYKYEGVDKSLTSKYFMNSFHTKLLIFVPIWMAPNVLTLFGFMCAVSSFLLTLCTDYMLSNQKYRIVFLINAFLIFAYQAFDSMDGKQARRLGASSPLGQLFDHGCDMFVLLFVCTSLSSALGLGLGYDFILLYLSFLTVYFVCCVEEYFVGVFYLGYINGPSEGILLVCLLHIFSFLFGNDSFKLLSSFKIFKVPIISLISLIFIFLTFLISTISILRNKKIGSGKDVIYMILNGYLLFTNTILNVLNKKFESVLSLYLLLLCLTFLMGKLTLEISYSHLKKCEVGNTGLLFKVYVYGSIMMLWVRVQDMVLFGIFIGIVCGYVEKAVGIVNEVCEVLEIECFKVKKTKCEQ